MGSGSAAGSDVAVTNDDASSRQRRRQKRITVWEIMQD
jgi:hypothetical protein